MANRKLHIPAPDEQVDEVEGDISIVFLSVIFCVGLMFGLLYFFSIAQAQSDGDGGETAVKAEPKDPRQALLKGQRALASEFDDWTVERLEDHAWKEEEEVAVFRFGPRAATEALCRKHRDVIVAGKLDPIRSIELLKVLERRVEFAPWTCMTRLYLDGKLPADGPLGREMKKFWDETLAFVSNARPIMSVLADIRETRDRPTVPEFYEWVRLCALNYDYQGAVECRKLLRQLTPQQGTDMLAMADRHLRTAGELSERDALIITSALGRLARNGQPPNWRVKDAEGIPDYDTDLRNASILYLCRFVHSPNSQQAVMGAEELRSVADAAGRAYDARLLERWRETCRIGFDGGKTAEVRRSIPIVASWDGQEGSLPNYSLEVVQKLGICPVEPKRPTWWCGANQWAGKLEDLERSLASYFIETRYMEWPAPDEPLLSPP